MAFAKKTKMLSHLSYAEMQSQEHCGLFAAKPLTRSCGQSFAPDHKMRHTFFILRDWRKFICK